MAFKPACQFCQESHNVMECQCDDTPKVEVEDKPKAPKGTWPNLTYTSKDTNPYGGAYWCTCGVYDAYYCTCGAHLR